MLEFVVVITVIVVMVAGIMLYNKKKGIVSQYDERQLLIRGNAYKAGFFTTIALLAVSMIAVSSLESLAQYAVGFLSVSLFGGILVFAAYSILKDAFFQLKDNGKSYLMLLLVVTLSQFTALLADDSWNGLADLFRTRLAINFCCGITFAVIMILLFVKKSLMKEDEE